MFIEPFDGILSGPLNQAAAGSAAGSMAGAQALGSSEMDAATIGAFGLMPGWIIAALANTLGL